jgi:hypothetical protein
VIGKVVQTEVDASAHRLLEEIVKKRRMTIKEALREAVASWIGLQTPLEDDWLFEIKPIRTGVKTNSSRLDGLSLSASRIDNPIRSRK